MKSLACITALVVGLASAAAAQESLGPPTIIVTGTGTARAQPDQFKVEARVEGRGSTQSEALRVLSVSQSRLMEGLPRLDGLTRGRVFTGEVSIDPVASDACTERSRRGEECPPEGYYARTAIVFEGAPAERAGDAVSLASELGAAQASLDGYRLADSAALKAEANRAAFDDAQAQAGRLSDASGRRIVGILRIQDPTAARPDGNSTNTDDVIVTGSRIQSAVRIHVAPQPVEATSRLTVVFEIE